MQYSFSTRASIQNRLSPFLTACCFRFPLRRELILVFRLSTHLPKTNPNAIDSVSNDQTQTLTLIPYQFSLFALRACSGENPRMRADGSGSCCHHFSPRIGAAAGRWKSHSFSRFDGVFHGDAERPLSLADRSAPAACCLSVPTHWC